jgi:PAS domain S-box-containing protein
MILAISMKTTGWPSLSTSPAFYTTSGDTTWLIANSPDFIFQQDANLKYVWALNQGVLFPGKTIVGKSDFELFPDNDARALVVIKKRVLKTGVREKAEIRTKIGETEGYGDAVIEPFKDAKGDVKGIIGYVRDVTERKKVEERLLRAERLEMAGRIAGQVAHDFNNKVSPTYT